MLIQKCISIFPIFINVSELFECRRQRFAEVIKVIGGGYSCHIYQIMCIFGPSPGWYSLVSFSIIAAAPHVYYMRPKALGGGGLNSLPPLAHLWPSILPIYNL